MKNKILKAEIAFASFLLGVFIFQFWIKYHPYSDDSLKFFRNNTIACAVLNNDIVAVRDLITSKTNINEPINEMCSESMTTNFSPENVTPLMLASTKGYLDIVKILLENRADVSLMNSHGETALVQAVSNGHIEIVKILLDKGSDPNTSSEMRRCSVLITAVKTGNKQIVELLVNKGANINTQDINGTSPLMIASAYKNKDIVNLLLSKGANPILKDDEGRTVEQYLKNGYPQNYILRRR